MSQLLTFLLDVNFAIIKALLTAIDVPPALITLSSIENANHRDYTTNKSGYTQSINWFIDTVIFVVVRFQMVTGR